MGRARTATGSKVTQQGMRTKTLASSLPLGAYSILVPSATRREMSLTSNSERTKRIRIFSLADKKMNAQQK